jgi:catechol 2,3-dioxygenase-like lactoylglutathione lyase family enzyme
MTAAPTFGQVNLVVRDMDASLAFYRSLGLDFPDPPEWPEGSGARHAECISAGGALLELDNVPMATLWHPGVRTESLGGTAVIGLALESRDAVDELYTAVTAAGHSGALEPYDAFWGARYAVVRDPDGYEIGLMSPIDPDRRHVPEVGRPS